MALFNYECDEVKRKIDEVSPNYPQLTTFEKEWLFFHKYHYIPGIPVELEYETVTVNPYGMVTNVIPFNYKSAILSGQTLVNLAENENAYVVGNGVSANRKVTKNSNSTKIEIVGTEVSCVVVFDSNYQLKANTKYTITFDSSTTGFEDKMVIGFHSNNGSYTVASKSVTTNNGKNKIVLSTPSEFEIVGITIGRHGAIPVGSTIQISNMIVLEGEYTDHDIPYFTGMTSCKMPVLKATGENVLNPDKFVGWNGSVESNDGVIINVIKQANDQNMRMLYENMNLPLNTYTITVETVNGNYLGGSLCVYDDKIKNIREIVIKSGKSSSTITSKISQLKIWNPYGVDCQIRITITTNGSTTYEPYKSNILTVNEDVTLRGIGDVKDELNLLTGELTQRIGEIMLDGSDDENWVKRNNGDGTNTITFQIPFDANKHDEIILDKFALSQSSSDGIEGFGYASDIKVLYIEIKRDRLNNVNVDEFKQWLSQNPITVQYTLTTESVKTVDLIPLTKPYEGTNHYQLTSNIPCEAILEVPVVSTGKQTLEEINN